MCETNVICTVTNRIVLSMEQVHGLACGGSLLCMLMCMKDFCC